MMNVKVAKEITKKANDRKTRKYEKRREKYIAKILRKVRKTAKKGYCSIITECNNEFSALTTADRLKRYGYEVEMLNKGRVRIRW
jgi:Skp family chaperone for outer membrane proteins